MATGTIAHPRPFQYVDDTAARADITLTSGGYFRVVPPSLPTGAKIISVAIVAWTSATGAFSVMPYGTGAAEAYILGTPSVTIKGLKLRFWYVI